MSYNESYPSLTKEYHKWQQFKIRPQTSYHVIPALEVFS